MLAAIFPQLNWLRVSVSWYLHTLQYVHADVEVSDRYTARYRFSLLVRFKHSETRWTMVSEFAVRNIMLCRVLKKKHPRRFHWHGALFFWATPGIPNVCVSCPSVWQTQI